MSINYKIWRWEIQYTRKEKRGKKSKKHSLVIGRIPSDHVWNLVVTVDNVTECVVSL